MPPPGQPKKPVEPSVANRDRNEYIPSFISKKPFYIPEDDTTDYLEHQRLHKAEDESKSYDRTKKIKAKATKFRKGACENCGAMGHKVKDCLSRPRKLGARWTGKDIAADEERQARLEDSWDAKRDQYATYDASQYNETVVREYEEMETLKRLALKNQEQDDEEEGDAKGDRYEEEADMGRNQSTATRNLRIREDVAGYLKSLDPESAKYDPKTRTMLSGSEVIDQASELVAEEGFMRASGEAAEFEKAQSYAWESQERGGKDQIHLQANPTSAQFLRKKEKEDAEKKRDARNKTLLEKYGGAEHLQAAPLKDAAVIESERFVEYDESGRIKGEPKPIAKSKYAEDVFIHNHTSVWGSWWSNFQWGYACCHSTVKNSYCTGEEGKQAFEESSRLRIAGDIEVPKEIAWKEEEVLEKHVPNAVESDEKAKRDEKDQEAPKKRTLNEMMGGITEEEMDEYRRKKTSAADPMAGMLGQDELVH
ncbi:Pre-mRNA-splicing factor slu7 [Eremomyces bilateralis CBS 781.70]|uniref:Pre-mRNA-splicing factor SLU7 n=1 Tax=Eremomyces bilateralis CBS 781.70 TaxID=1392243 RepID=A0A6G1FW01_9PEZI|nr:Pre-mRNA-splicing factor slu7 [Eremomyces bilateralis CBS 781.70]KAF1809953.1 Pre-mRNA-splicing factor slu7 [Eremomyces bilateralis CBS 781.70]